MLQRLHLLADLQTMINGTCPLADAITAKVHRHVVFIEVVE